MGQMWQFLAMMSMLNLGATDFYFNSMILTTEGWRDGSEAESTSCPSEDPFSSMMSLALKALGFTLTYHTHSTHAQLKVIKMVGAL